MSDLHTAVPRLDLRKYSHLIHSLQKHDYTVADLISLEPSEIARRCPLPLLDVRRLVADVIRCLQIDCGMFSEGTPLCSEPLAPTSDTRVTTRDQKHDNLSHSRIGFIKTLDARIDEVLGGGFATGHISEVVGESSAGKTQLLYSLLLSVQLPEPQGLGKSAVYLSTEEPLNTSRLAQILDSQPVYRDMPEDRKPSMDNVLIFSIKDLVLQQNVIEYQLPHVISSRNVGLIVIDSITANFRGEGKANTSNNLLARAAELNRLGHVLHRLAMEENVAVVVANQVSDRFAESLVQPTQDIASSSPSTPSTQSTGSVQRSQRSALMTLDHQQRFFTGWGDKPNDQLENVKTPTLGLVWTNILDARVVCKIAEGNETKRRRIINVVFAPWTDQKVRSVEFTIEAQGLVSKETTIEQGDEHRELLDERFWQTAEDEEFP